MTGLEEHDTRLVDRDLVEEVDVGDQVATPETPLALDQEQVAAVAQEGIARLLITGLAEALAHQGGVAHPQKVSCHPRYRP